ncbi:MAG: MaoC family dehydratase [Pseudoxanthomonas sp.]
MRIIETLDALPAWIGREVACSDWMEVDQDRIQRFADATGDQQWIHTDPQRAQRESPFKNTIAHGYLTLSLLPHLFASCLRIDGVGVSLNYGLDRVRFPAPLPVGRRIRARLALEKLETVSGGVQAHWAATVELERGDKPVCVAQMLVRYYPDH